MGAVTNYYLFFSCFYRAREGNLYLSQYSYNKTDSTFSFTSTSGSEDWLKDREINANSIYDWATALYADMFSKW